MCERRNIIRFLMVALTLAACAREPERAPNDARQPKDLVEIAAAVEELPFSEAIEKTDLRPGPTTHRFFEGSRGHNLGVGVTFDDPVREPELNIHFDQTEEGAQEQFEELRMALEGGLLPASDDARFCSATGAWVECAAVEEKHVVAARAKDEVPFVQGLLEFGLTYAQEVSW